LITGAAETNIVVRRPRGIVQIQRECPSVAIVIPIAATLEPVLVLPFYYNTKNKGFCVS